MKNKKTLLVIGVLAMIILVFSMNFYKIKFVLNFLDLYTKKTSINKEEPTKDIDNVLDNPLLSILESEKAEEDESDNSDNNNDNNMDTDERKTKTNNKPIKTIASKYNDNLTSIQNNFQGELNALVEQGYQEYKSGEVSSSQLANSYVNQGSSLEKKCDKMVDSTLKDMKKELKSNGHDTTLIKEAKAYYESFKERERNKLFDAAFDKLDK